MSRLMMSCGLLVSLLLFSGCGNRTETSEQTTSNETEQHSEFERSMELKLAEIDAQIDTLKVHTEVAGAKAKAEMQEDLAGLEMQREKVKAKLAELRTSTVETWDQTRLALVSELDTLDAKFDRAREKMHQ